MEDLKGKIAVVTGGARGIGQAIAKRLAEDGADIVCVDLAAADETRALVERSGRKAISLVADVSSYDALVAAAEEAEKRLGPVHILVNNAALHPHMTYFDNVTPELWRKTMSVNFDSMFYAVKAFVPHMQKNGWGRIVNMSSSVVNVAPAGGIHYIASKAGVLGLTRGLARELGEYKITVNAIAPSMVDTPGFEAMGLSQEMVDAVVASQSIKSLTQVSDLTGVVSFLCSQGARLYTGQHVHLDGGIVFAD